ncbi:hypothetical protein CIW52_23645 [Mycolicibacterium sp. P9-64]|uniref:hypothetical protein n=1 Tax=Mycolicibacterium sp. P9-64 TaxID=2024612 RepID=UPI0011ECE00A|nr:hypothetical protein [Mycolicibacterium sp. P9-64]KAA0080597.1 hypothetical protein CIW52_23645 [Mycolicibacterium sp. P9-64]
MANSLPSGCQFAFISGCDVDGFLSRVDRARTAFAAPETPVGLDVSGARESGVDDLFRGPSPAREELLPGAREELGVGGVR